MANRSLICITTCNRLLNVKSFVWDYLSFCSGNDAFDFVLSVDGQAPDYAAYCRSRKIRSILSAEREGVCLSKNRVLESFPDYDYYFFIDDDAELLNPAVFNLHIEASKRMGIHHFVLGERGRLRGNVQVQQREGHQVATAQYGTGHFTFYTREGIQRVGGFHTEFAKYKRFGHTEHSYRFVHAGLQEHPFVMILDAEPMLNWYNPPSVTTIKVDRDPESRLAIVELDIIRQKLAHFPLATIGRYEVLDTETPADQVARGLSMKPLHKSRFFTSNLFLKVRNKLFS